MNQSIAFVTDRKGKSIAYATSGRGRPLVADTGFVSHLELQWAYPPYRRFFEALSHNHRVIPSPRASGEGAVGDPQPEASRYPAGFEVVLDCPIAAG